MLRHANSLGLSVGIITNGTSLNDRSADAICKYGSFCRISMDTISKNEYIRIRGANHLDLVLRNVERLVNRKRRLASTVLIGVHIVWSDQKFDEITAAAHHFSTVGIDFLQIRPVDNVPTRSHSPTFGVGPLREMRSFLERLKASFDSEDFSVIPSTSKWTEVLDGTVGKDYVGCLGGNLTCSIGHDFKVYFCCTHIGNPYFALGDLSSEPLARILKSKKRRQFIKAVDHRLCQNQCRNHHLNKSIQPLLKLTREELRFITEAKTKGSLPLHWEFL